jgi:O-antigen/teichoic acid export membrane protein
MAPSPDESAVAPRGGVFRHHLLAFFTGGVLSLTRLATGFVRNKYVALVLGPAGVGFIQQATQLQLLGISIASLSMAVGIINRMGAVAGKPQYERRLLSTAFTAQTTVSVALLAGAVLFAKPLANAVFGAEALARSPISTLDILAVVFSVPLSVVASGYLEAVFFGSGRYPLYVRASMWATVLGFLSTLGIIYVWRLPGVFWSFFFASSLLCTSFIFFVRRVRPLDKLFHFGFDFSEANALIRFSAAVLVSGALVPTARLWIGRRVIELFGIEANGLLGVPFAVTGYYTPFLTSALWGRMHPVVTRVGASPEGRHELTTALRLIVGMATAAIVSILYLKDYLVPLAYSRAFVPAAHLLPIQLLGDYFYFVGLPFTVYALGISRLRVYLAVWVSYAVVAVAASFAFMPLFQLNGVPLGYGISNAIGAAVALGWLIYRREEGLGVTLAIVGTGFVVVFLESYIAWHGGYRMLETVLFVTTVASALAWLWHERQATA